MATILATLSISKVKGDDGKEFTPEAVFTLGITRFVFSSYDVACDLTIGYCGYSSLPRPFVCSIQPRNEMARSLISQIGIADAD